MIQETPISEGNKLLRILGVGFGLAIVVGGMIGGGILRTPGIVAANLGDAWLIMAAWTFGGVYTLMAANSYAEMGTMIPKAGGPYVFARHAYGNFGGFVTGWSDWFLNACGVAFLSIATAEYAATLFPLLAGYVGLTAASILIVFTVLHWFGLRAGAGAQKITSFFKVLAFIILVVACFIYGGKVDAAPATQSLTTFTENPVLSFLAVIISLQFIIETYAGYNSPVYFSEENKDTARNIPRALFGGVLTVIVLYLLVNLALLYVLPVSEIAASKLPAADAASAIFGETGGTVITVISLLSLLGIVNAISMQTPRILFAMSRDGLFAPQAMTVNRRGTPTVALFMTMLAAVVLAISGTFESLFAITAFMGVSVDTGVFVALIVLRRRQPDIPRPFKAIGYPFVPLIVAAVSLVLLVAYAMSNTQPSLIALAAMLLSYPVYLTVRKRVSANLSDRN